MGIELLGTIYSECKCVEPDYDVVWKTRRCAACGSLIRTIEVVLCRKCGGRVSDEAIPEEILKQEQNCGHNIIDGAFEALRPSD